jgi:hypothetical protein
MKTLALALALLMAGSAAAHDLEHELRDYYRGEKHGGLWFAGVGLATAGVGGVLVSRDNDFLRGMSYPIFAVSLIEILAGAILYFRTERLVRGRVAELRANPAALLDKEGRYLKRVNFQFRLLEGVEIALMLGGLATFCGGAAADSDTWQGVGVGLAIQAAAMLALDHAAHVRSQRYGRILDGISLSASSQQVTLGFSRSW